MEEGKVWTLDEVRRTKCLLFDQIVEEAKEMTGGDKDKQSDYVTAKIIIDFRRKLVEEKMQRQINCSKFSEQEDQKVWKRKERENDVENKKCRMSEERKDGLNNNRKKSEKIYDFCEHHQQQQPDMPFEYRNNIEEKMGAKATDIKLVISKHLFASELSKQQNRFSMPSNQVLAKNFLTQDEEDELKKRDEWGKYVGLDVMFIDPSFKVRTDMCLKKWEINASSSYILNKGWISMMKDNKELKKNTNVELWSFRVKGKLGFQLVIKD